MLPLKDNIPTVRFPIVTVLLILINIGAFVWELTLPTDQASSHAFRAAGVSEQDQAILEYGAIPFRLTHPGKECGVIGAFGRMVLLGSNGSYSLLHGFSPCSQVWHAAKRPNSGGRLSSFLHEVRLITNS